MNKTYDILLAGFGGQGILFAGKSLAFAGMKNNCKVSWIPSYGPEMRGGTCNCSVVVSDEEVGCPIVTQPNVLLVMNLPSFEKFEPAVVSGGLVIADSSLVSKASERKDIKFIGIPATKLATENGVPILANMILVGKMLKETGFLDYDFFINTVKEAAKGNAKALEQNLKAIEIGYNY